ncbi:MAG TPA: reverse transcriptase/maturase family protein [Candidatus Nanoarchaeia archaeon]|nr:reverse transcriptase/maturase family protein [Candidatus Nanoarchaeia archaeon]
MKTYKNLFSQLCSLDNLQSAYEKAKKRKASSPRVQKFAEHWQLHLVLLRKELLSGTYKPQPLRRFVLRDPKTRVICVSDFRDRVVHHALVNILQPIFQPRFIHDSFASQKGKGALLAIRRLERFMRKVSRNGRIVTGEKNANAVEGFVLKADIYHYFETVDRGVLLSLISERVKDEGILWLVKAILDNYDSETPGKGMPLGNWTSQFFANIYLHEMDRFVKHALNAKYYIRYVDDFVILDRATTRLQEYESRINEFLKKLKIELHPAKCKVIPLGRGIPFLGFRVFYHYKLVRARNLRKIRARLRVLLQDYQSWLIHASEVLAALNGWNGYAMHGNTHLLRQKIASETKTALQGRAPCRIP